MLLWLLIVVDRVSILYELGFAFADGVRVSHQSYCRIRIGVRIKVNGSD